MEPVWPRCQRSPTHDSSPACDGRPARSLPSACEISAAGLCVPTVLILVSSFALVPFELISSVFYQNLVASSVQCAKFEVQKNAEDLRTVEIFQLLVEMQKERLSQQALTGFTWVRQIFFFFFFFLLAPLVRGSSCARD